MENKRLRSGRVFGGNLTNQQGHGVSQGLKKQTTTAIQRSSSAVLPPPPKALDKENVRNARQPLKLIEPKKDKREEEEVHEEEESDGAPEETSSSEEEGGSEGEEEEDDSQVKEGEESSTSSNECEDDDDSHLACDEEMEEEEEEQQPSSDEESVQVVTSGKRKMESFRDARETKRARKSNSRRSKAQSLPTIHPVHPADAYHINDPLEVVEYVEDMYLNSKEKEVSHSAKPYMHTQKDINVKMRAILVDWLVEVHLKFKLLPQTLYLTVNLLDRYCQDAVVNRSRLQCVGVASLLIACKYEEVFPPEVRDCVYITDHAYSREDILKMEENILSSLHFKVTVPTIHTFLTRFLKIAQGSHLLQHRAEYYAERALQEYDILKHTPSLIAAAAVYLALKAETLDCWPPSLERYTKYKVKELLPVAAMLARFVHEPTQTANRRILQSVKKKFATSKYMEVAELDHPKPDHVV